MKRQKRLRLNSSDWVLRLGRLSLLKRFGPGMMDSLNGVQYLVKVWLRNLNDGLNVKTEAFAGARIDQKTGKQLKPA